MKLLKILTIVGITTLLTGCSVLTSDQPVTWDLIMWDFEVGVTRYPYSLEPIDIIETSPPPKLEQKPNINVEDDNSLLQVGEN